MLRGQPHPPRPRRSALGELVQIDVRPHDWLEGRGPRCTLIAFIGDATSQVMAACFTEAKTTQAYLDGLQAYVLAYGCPAALYSDRHGIFTNLCGQCLYIQPPFNSSVLIEHIFRLLSDL